MRRVKCKKWSIAKGGYDLWWEIYYEGYTVLQCIVGKLEGGFRPIPDFTEEAGKFAEEMRKKYYGEFAGGN